MYLKLVFVCFFKEHQSYVEEMPLHLIIFKMVHYCLCNDNLGTNHSEIQIIIPVKKNRLYLLMVLRISCCYRQ